MKITITPKSGKNLVATVLAHINTLSAEHLKRIAKETEQVIREQIRSSLSHPEYSSGRLENSLIAEQMTENSWGIGNINNLNTNVPYWRHINYGSQEIGANWEHWLPKGRWVDGLWVEDENGFYAKPSKPIEPHNYIERTVARVHEIINKNLSTSR